MASFATHQSEADGVKAAFPDEHDRLRERRKSPEPSRLRSGTDIEDIGTPVEQVQEEEDDNNTAWSDDSPPDNSP
jgi:hypothetical protein